MNPAELNRRHGQPGLKFVAGPDGLIFAEFDNPAGTATLCLQGAHLVTWKPKGESEPVIWVSEMAKYAPGKSIRGGVPICWPWFGPHATEGSYPGHGFARTVMWEVTGSEEAEGRTELTLALLENDQTRAQWPHACRAELKVGVGAQLDLALTTTNLGDRVFQIGEALHTYFYIGDIGRVEVAGLEGVEYVDKVEGGARKRQSGSVTFVGEVDRVYVSTEAECVIHDPDLKRRIHIAKTGGQSTVLWTPWVEKAEKMGDFGPGRRNQGGWREMVCVESGNALDNVVEVPAGASHRLAVAYRVVKA